MLFSNLNTGDRGALSAPVSGTEFDTTLSALVSISDGVKIHSLAKADGIGVPEIRGWTVLVVTLGCGTRRQPAVVISSVVISRLGRPLCEVGDVQCL